MRRSPLRRAPLARRTPIRQVNRARRARAHERCFGERAEYVREMLCLARGHIGAPCQGPVEAAHAVARGMGAAKGTRRHLVPLCGRHHRESGERGTDDRRAFERRYEINLEAEAARIAAELDALGIP